MIIYRNYVVILIIQFQWLLYILFKKKKKKKTKKQYITSGSLSFFSLPVFQKFLSFRTGSHFRKDDHRLSLEFTETVNRYT